MRKTAFSSGLLGLIGTLGLAASSLPAQAARWADVTVINRSTGERLTPIRHDGKLYVPGTPGDRYGIELANRDGRRLLTVISVDGVNVLTGQTAAPLQSGYVLNGGQRYSITGWRKNMDEVAQFVFTALPNSYAARTGRPDNVGVIGVAVYREKVEPPAPVALAPGRAYRDELRDELRNELRDEPRAQESERAAPAPAAPSKSLGAAKMDAAESSAAGALAERRRSESSPPAEKKERQRLGTGHGEREHAPTRSTEFARASDSPDEVITIYYDSRSNLIARGIIRAPRLAEPQPFPGGFVPDPRG